MSRRFHLNIHIGGEIFTGVGRGQQGWAQALKDVLSQLQQTEDLGKLIVQEEQYQKSQKELVPTQSILHEDGELDINNPHDLQEILHLVQKETGVDLTLHYSSGRKESFF